MIYNLVLDLPYAHVLPLLQTIFEEEGFTVRKSCVEDGLLLNIREEQKDTFNNKDLDLLLRTHAYLEMLTPMNYAVFGPGGLLLLASILVVCPGVAEITFLVDENLVSADKKTRFKLIRAFRQAIEILPFRRIQAKVKDSFTIGRNFVEKLGFESEGLLRKYGPDSDYILYSKLH